MSRSPRRLSSMCALRSFSFPGGPRAAVCAPGHARCRRRGGTVRDIPEGPAPPPLLPRPLRQAYGLEMKVQCRYRGVVEEGPYADLDAEAGTDPADDPGSEQGLPAQVEEVVVWWATRARGEAGGAQH